MTFCAAEGCERDRRGRTNWCEMHRQRLAKYGDVNYQSPGMRARALTQKFWQSITQPEALGDGPCIEWPGGVSQKGYGHCSRGRWGESVVSRAAWVAAYGPISPGLWVLHKCDNPPCGRPGHLFLGTAADNTKDMLAKGRSRPAAGDTSGKIVVPDSYVLELRQRWLAGEQVRELADEVGMRPDSMSRLLRGHRRNVTTPTPILANPAQAEKQRQRTERDSRIVELYQQGLSTIDVGNVLGIAAGTVSRRLRALGVQARSTADYYPADAQEIARQYRAGAGIKSLSKQHRITGQRVSALIRSTGTEVRRPGRPAARGRHD